MGALSPTHWLIIIGLVVVLFGAKKLPMAARSMGQSLRILKAETSELRSKDGDGSAAETAAQSPAATAPAATAPAAPAPAAPAPAAPAPVAVAPVVTAPVPTAVPLPEPAPRPAV
ncbi:Sec-independent protein translocase subunit TatA [Pseudonocardia sp. GCM10023141]|uniref:Sec-independent protein translocase subunit TatA n=1 Tax=Pseudonocardia sp. GCM10023141 TaxID=3252653 RepID=UPI00360C3E08